MDESFLISLSPVSVSFDHTALSALVKCILCKTGCMRFAECDVWNGCTSACAMEHGRVDSPLHISC